MNKSHLLALTLVAILTACANEPTRSLNITPMQPEAASGYTPKQGWATQRFAVAAANPLATDAGFQILKAGGSAVDAAIAVQMVLGLVEPQSSGVGGALSCCTTTARMWMPLMAEKLRQPPMMRGFS